MKIKKYKKLIIFLTLGILTTSAIITTVSCSNSNSNQNQDSNNNNNNQNQNPDSNTNLFDFELNEQNAQNIIKTLNDISPLNGTTKVSVAKNNFDNNKQKIINSINNSFSVQNIESILVTTNSITIVFVHKKIKPSTNQIDITTPVSVAISTNEDSIVILGNNLFLDDNINQPWIKNPSTTTTNIIKPASDVITNENFNSKTLSVSNWTEVTQEYDCSNITNQPGWVGWPSQSKPWNAEDNKKFRHALMGENVFNCPGYPADEFENNPGLPAGKYDYSNPDFINYQIKTNQLKKHPSANNAWIKHPTPQNQKAVTKEIEISSFNKGVVPLGLYAAPGQVVKIKFKNGIQKKDLEQLKLKIVINKEFDGIGKPPYHPNINMRMPKIQTYFDVAKYFDPITNIIEIGSPYGGSISLLFENYYEPIYTSKNVLFEISNVLEMLTYVHNFTTEQEWKRLLKETNTPIAIWRVDGLSVMQIAFLNETNNKSEYAEMYSTFPYEQSELFQKFVKLSRYAINADREFSARNVLVKAQDIIHTGSANCNPATWEIESPQSWVPVWDPKIGLNPRDCWGFMHEINHCFQGGAGQSDMWGLNDSVEVSNNVLNVLSTMAFSKDSNYRDENNITGFDSNGWAWTGNGFSIFKNQPSKNDLLKCYLGVAQTVGVKNYVDLIRNNLNTNAIKLNRVQKNMWFAIQQCNQFKINLFDFFDLFTSNTPDSSVFDSNQSLWTPEMVSEYNKIINTYPKYFPTANMYANRQLIKVNDGNWLDSGWLQQPYRVSANTNTVFKLAKFTNSFKTIGKNNEDYFGNVQILQQPKFGEIISNDGKNVIYKPNFNSTDQVDNFVFSIDDIENNTYYFEIMIQPSWTINNISYSTYNTNSSIQTTEELLNKINNNEIIPTSSEFITQNEIYTDSINPYEAKLWKFKYIPKKNETLRWKGIWDKFVLIKVDGKTVFEKNQWNNSTSGFPSESKGFDVFKDTPINVEVLVWNKQNGKGVTTRLWLEEVLNTNHNKSLGKIDSISRRSIKYNENFSNETLLKFEYKFVPQYIPSQNFPIIANDGNIFLRNQNAFQKVMIMGTPHDKYSSQNNKGPKLEGILNGDPNNSLFHTDEGYPSAELCFWKPSVFKFNQIKIFNREQRYSDQFPRKISLFTYHKGNINGNVDKSQRKYIIKNQEIKNWNSSVVNIDFKEDIILDENTYFGIELTSNSNILSFRNINFTLRTNIDYLVPNFDKQKIKYSENWIEQKNGILNNKSISSKTKGSWFEFETNSKDFLIGSHSIPFGTVNVYIDNQLVLNNYDIGYEQFFKKDINSTNQSWLFVNTIFRWKFNDNLKHKIKIELNSNDEFILDFIGL